MIRRGVFLSPAFQTDRDEMDRLPRGVALTVKVTRTASPKMKAWYRALLAKIVEATGAWPTESDAHRQLLIRCGFCQSIVINGAGDVRVTPESTAEWDGAVWRRYLDELLIVLVTEHFPSIRRQDLLYEIESMVGISLNDAMSGE